MIWYNLITIKERVANWLKGKKEMLVRVYERVNNKKVLIDVDFYSIASIKKMQMSGYLVENLTK